MRDKILAFVKQNGPSLPVEIKGCENSFLAKAYLSELVEKGLLKQSSEKVGDSFIYFAAGQEGAAQEKIKSLGVVKTTKTYASKKVEVTPEVAKKREEFETRLKDIEKKEKVKPKPIVPKVEVKQEQAPVTQSKAQSKPKPVIIPPKKVEFKPIQVEAKKPFFEFAKEAVKKVISQPKYYEKKVDTKIREDFVDRCIKFLVSKNIEILQKDEKPKSADLIVNVPSAVGNVKFIVKIKSKKKISKSELVDIYAKALEQRMPAILLTTGEMAQTSKKYLKTVGGFLRVKVF